MRLHGKVVHGEGIGRTLGYPTANILLENFIDFRGGVYAAEVTTPDGRVWDAMANLGKRPTFSANGDRVLELHLFDFDGDLYDLRIQFNLFKHIRDEQKFPGTRELRRQIEKDKYAVQNALAIRRSEEL